VIIFWSINIAVTKFSSAVIQTINQSSDFNLESSVDLEYGMALTNPQPVSLLQVGDLAQG
jgi:tripeptidyl-peptidase I